MASGYKVVFAGNLVPGVKPDMVRHALRERFKLADAEIDRFFTSQPMVLKVTDDQQVAMKYKRELIEAGVDCRIVELTDKGRRLLRPKLTQPVRPSQAGHMARSVGAGDERLLTSPADVHDVASAVASRESPNAAPVEPLPLWSAPPSRVVREERRIVEVREEGAFSGRQAIGLLGSVLLVIGVFSPIVSIPIMGAISYIHDGRGDGVLILIAALISFVMVIARQYWALYWTGGFGLLVMIFTIALLTSRIADVKQDMARDLAGNPFRGLANAAMSAVHLEWGWGLLIAGAVLLLVSAGYKAR